MHFCFVTSSSNKKCLPKIFKHTQYKKWFNRFIKLRIICFVCNTTNYKRKDNPQFHHRIMRERMYHTKKWKPFPIFQNFFYFIFAKKKKILFTFIFNWIVLVHKKGLNGEIMIITFLNLGKKKTIHFHATNKKCERISFFTLL